MEVVSERVTRVVKPSSYFFVFTEGYSNEEELMETIFTSFNEKHRSDTNVTILKPENPKFEEMRRKLEIKKLPGFAIADEPIPQPFISFDRGNYIMEKLQNKGREFYELISDLHYSLTDEGLVRVNKKMSHARLSYIFGKLWDEVKDLVTISSP